MNTTKPKSHLFSNVGSREYNYAYKELLRYREKYPAYRDDELLMRMYCDLKLKFMLGGVK